MQPCQVAPNTRNCSTISKLRLFPTTIKSKPFMYKFLDLSQPHEIDKTSNPTERQFDTYKTYVFGLCILRDNKKTTAVALQMRNSTKFWHLPSPLLCCSSYVVLACRSSTTGIQPSTAVIRRDRCVDPPAPTTGKTTSPCTMNLCTIM